LINSIPIHDKLSENDYDNETLMYMGDRLGEGSVEAGRGERK
jgi:hypothetical protein